MLALQKAIAPPLSHAKHEPKPQLSTGRVGASVLVQGEMVFSTTSLSEIPRANRIAIRWVYHRSARLDLIATPCKSDFWSGEESPWKGRHVQHSDPNSKPAKANCPSLHALRQYSTVLRPPVIWFVRVLAIFASLFTKCTHLSEVPLPNKRAKDIYLREASHVTPLVELSNNSVRNNGCSSCSSRGNSRGYDLL